MQAQCCDGKMRCNSSGVRGMTAGNRTPGSIEVGTLVRWHTGRAPPHGRSGSGPKSGSSTAAKRFCWTAPGFGCIREEGSDGAVGRPVSHVFEGDVEDDLTPKGQQAVPTQGPIG